MPEETKKEVEEMKEFMTVLMEVKVSLADQNGKLDSLLDMKPKVERSYDIANSAESRSLVNQKDIDYLQKKITTKADKQEVKEDVARIVEEKDNWRKNLPVWVAVFISVVSILLQFN